VRTQSQRGRDVTREHVTAKDRLQSARAERRSLLRRLELAATDEQAESIRRRLDLVAGRDQEPAGAAARPAPAHGLCGRNREPAGKGRRTRAAAQAARSTTRSATPATCSWGLAGVIVRVLAVGLPLGLIVLAGWLAGRAFTRRRRESALA